MKLKKGMEIICKYNIYNYYTLTQNNYDLNLIMKFPNELCL